MNDYGAGGAALFDIVNVQIWTRRRVRRTYKVVIATACPRVIDRPTLSPQQDVYAPVAVANPRRSALLDAGFQNGLTAATRAIPVALRGKAKNTARTTLQRALTGRPQIFRRTIS
jgi:hypothetical protein